jgi:hypothetical protein
LPLEPEGSEKFPSAHVIEDEMEVIKQHSHVHSPHNIKELHKRHCKRRLKSDGLMRVNGK